MEFIKNDIKIYIISGKARSGKDTTMKLIKDFYEKKGISVVNLAFSDYIKMYVKKITSWDGSDETKPRELLQSIGTSLIRNKIDEEFFIKRVIEDINVYSYFFKVIIINDARLILEIEKIRENFKNVVSINITRNVNNDLTDNQKRHITETNLDNYECFDYNIENNGSLEELEIKVDSILRSEYK